MAYEYHRLPQSAKAPTTLDLPKSAKSVQPSSAAVQRVLYPNNIFRQP